MQEPTVGELNSIVDIIRNVAKRIVPPPMEIDLGDVRSITKDGHTVTFEQWDGREIRFSIDVSQGTEDTWDHLRDLLLDANDHWVGLGNDVDNAITKQEVVDDVDREDEKYLKYKESSEFRKERG